MSAERVSATDVESALEDLRETSLELGIDGAQYWQVQNPFGPTGYHFLEVHHDDGYWVSTSTALGAYTWQTRREAHAALRTMWRALLAARKVRSLA